MLDNGVSKRSGNWSGDCCDRETTRNEVASSDGEEMSDNERTSALAELDEKEKTMKNENIKVAVKLMERAASNNGLIGLRSCVQRDINATETNDSVIVDADGKDMFCMFVDVCMVHMVPKKKWNDSHMNKHISTIVTVADEAFAMLVLENMSPDLCLEAEERNRMTRRTSKPKHTKSGKDKMGRIEGWRHSGVVRHNQLMRDVVKHRQEDVPLRKQIKENLRKRHMQERDEAEEDDLGEVNGNRDKNNCRVEECKDAVDPSEEMPLTSLASVAEVGTGGVPAMVPIATTQQTAAVQIKLELTNIF